MIVNWLIRFGDNRHAFWDVFWFMLSFLYYCCCFCRKRERMINIFVELPKCSISSHMQHMLDHSISFLVFFVYSLPQLELNVDCTVEIDVFVCRVTNRLHLIDWISIFCLKRPPTKWNSIGITRVGGNIHHYFFPRI